jgi:hypothetical protein
MWASAASVQTVVWAGLDVLLLTGQGDGVVELAAALRHTHGQRN